MNKWAERLKIKVNSAFSRFTPTIVSAVFATIMSWVLPRLDYNSQAYEVFNRLLWIGVLYVGVSFLVTVYCRENQKKLGLGLLGGLFISVVFVYPATLENFFWIQYFILNVVVYGMAFSLPFKKRAVGLPHFLLETFTHVLESFFFSGAIFIGIAGLIGAVDLLFDYLPYSDIYQDLAKGIFGIFAVTYFLGVISSMEGTFTYEHQPKVFRRLIVFILMPILIGYAVVLHAYFVKILIEFQLPEGMVGNLVLWYAIVSLIVLYLSRDYGAFSPFSKRFQQFYPFALIVPLGMFFMAIAVRTKAYGITPERYYAILVACYVAICVALLRVSKKDITTLVVWFSIPLMLLSAFGPLSAERLSYKSQVKRLEALLMSYDMLEGGQIKHNPNLVTVDKDKIESQVSYLVDRFDTNSLAYLPKDFTYDDAEAVFGFDFFRDYNRQEYFHVEALFDKKQGFKVEGSDYVIHLNAFNNFSMALDAPYRVAYDSETMTLSLYKGEALQTILVTDAALAVVDNPSLNPVQTVTFKDGTSVSLLYYFMEIGGNRSKENAKETRVMSFEVYVGIDLNP